MIYLLHFDKPLSHAQHYLGMTDDLKRRLTEHANGDGARITQVLCERNLSWQLAGLYIPHSAAETSRTIEKLAKNQHGLARFCPICNPLTSRTPAGTYAYDVDSIRFPITSLALRRVQE